MTAIGRSISALASLLSVGRCVVAVCLLGCLVLSGCGSRIDVKGNWLGYRKLDAQPGADPAVVKTLSKVDLRVDGHGRFRLFDQGIPKAGHVEYEDGKALLVIEDVMRQELKADERPEPPQLTKKSQGVLLFRDASSEAIELKRT